MWQKIYKELCKENGFKASKKDLELLENLEDFIEADGKHYLITKDETDLPNGKIGLFNLISNLKYWLYVRKIVVSTYSK